jgi:L-seryl-tRNA(Ser) seleniumtransferase
MENRETKNHAESLRLLPSVDALLRTGTAQKLISQTGARHLARLARAATDSLRRNLQEKIAAGQSAEHSREDLLAEAEKSLLNLWQSEQDAGLQRVINATGVIIHTNLGRAPLSENARRAVFEKASRYCNLEYSLETGKRGRRGARAEHLLAELTGAEAALIVNNCAAAAFLTLTVFAGADGGEVIISRGELVEIGGDFRVPEVLEQSGAILREVGATNRTRASDYEKAISEKTRMILRVHPSNYRIVGFTSTPSLKEIAEIARRNDLILYEDAGSGALFDLSPYGLTDEPVVSQSLAAGADVVTFSGDKLLGGVQAGLIVGRRELVEKLRRHPLYRALRVDKLIYAALESTFEAFRRDTVLEEIPVLKMLSATNEEIKARTLQFAQKLRERLGESGGLRFEITEGNSVIGGGSAPMVQPATTLLALSHEKMPVSHLEKALRLSKPPVITRILEDKVLIDLRTVAETEEAELQEVLADLIKI